MKRPLESLTKAEFESVKSSGLLWELYPHSPDVWEDIQMTIARFESMAVDNTTDGKEAKQ